MAKNFFVPYYQRKICHFFGLAIIHGGTGLGKTSGIPEVSRANPERKIIYLSNRIQLREEMAESLINKGLDFREQKSDFEQLLETPLEVILNNNIFQKYHRFLLRNSNESILSINKIREKRRELNAFEHLKNIEDSENLKGILVSKIIKPIKKVLQTAYFFQEGKLSNPPNSFDDSDYENLMELEAIQKLFPFISFKTDKDDKIPIFLVTLQKAFHGFFDGCRTINLERIRSLEIFGQNNLILIFDEFDFLENDLLNLITQDIEINLPFQFVKKFYENLTQKKLVSRRFLEFYPEIRGRIENINSEIRTLEDYSIDFPKIDHFVCTQDSDGIEKEIQNLEKQKRKTKNKNDHPKLILEINRLKKSIIKNISIFQTRFAIHQQALYLDDSSRQNSFDITTERGQRQFTAFTLFNVINRSISEIIRLFKDLEFSNPQLHQDLLNDCFKDAREFQNQVKLVRQRPFSWTRERTNYDKLHNNGFGLYEIKDLSKQSDPEEVDINYYAIFSTPEKILLDLAKHNLVFGLSATAILPRYVKNFDLRFIKRKLQNNFLETTTEDIELIKNANETKHKIRDNDVKVLTANHDQINTPEQKRLKNYLGSTFNHPESEDLFSSKYRQGRVFHFFSTIYWILNDRQRFIGKEHHILFLNSFRQIKFIFDKKMKSKKQELFSVSTVGLPESLFQVYELSIQNNNFIVVFYNTEQSRNLRKENDNLESYYKLFWEGKSVILITTFPSAGNGINLQYFSSKSEWKKRKDKKGNPDKDFQNIHLLEVPFYFFNKIEGDNIKAKIKANTFYLAKLRNRHLITDSQFKEQLRNLRDSGKFNYLYANTKDGICNKIAGLMQALGRIERVWEKMENQIIRLAKVNTGDVYDIFEKFVTNEELRFELNRIKPYCSNNMNSVFTQIEVYAKKQHKIIADWQWEGLQTLNKKCKRSIRGLLDDINSKVRRNSETIEATTTRNQWNRLRSLALKQDYYKGKIDTLSPLYKYNCVFEDKYEYYDYAQDCFWMDNQMNLIHAKNRNSDFISWNLNLIYDRINRSDLLSTHFNHRQFNTGVENTGIYFTPYFYRAFLVGAIGEEIVKAVFNKVDIDLNEKEIPNRLFELADTKIKGKAWFIDCKYYGSETLLRFPLPKNDPFYHPKLNEEYFQESALSKLRTIQEFYNTEDVKLIYINAFGGNDIPLTFLDDNFKKLSSANFKDAKIIWLNGVLTTNERNRWDTLTSDFNAIVNHIKTN